MLEVIRHPKLRVIIRMIILLLYMMFTLLPSGMIMLPELYRNPQSEGSSRFRGVATTCSIR